MPNPNGSNDSMDGNDKVNEIHTILSRYTEDLRKELASRDIRIANLQREFATMAARANAAEAAATEAKGWLTKISRVLHESGFVRGTYEESVKSLVADAKLVPELKQRLAGVAGTGRVLVERTLLDVETRRAKQLEAERDEALAILRAIRDAGKRSRKLLADTEDKLFIDTADEED